MRTVSRGVECFEGLVGGPEGGAKVAAFLDFLAAAARALDAAGLFAPSTVLLSAGHSAYYDLVAKKFGAAALRSETMILTRSGWYLTYDSGTYAFQNILERTPELSALGEGPRAAIEVWAYVQSCPEPGRALAFDRAPVCTIK